MSACKSALEEANGDEEKAIEILRKKGEAKSAERSDRLTSNGVVAIAQKEGASAMISLACETDFVAKNADFLKKAQELADKLLAEGEETDLSTEIAELNIAMGEKVEVKERKVVKGAKVGSYIHLNNRIGVLVSLTGGSEDLAKDLAMHVAAMSPKTLSPDQISDDLLVKEREIWADQLKQEGKPEQIVAKIMEGKEKKFREEFAFLTQAFVKNPDQLVKDLLGSETIEGFWRFEV